MTDDTDNLVSFSPHVPTSDSMGFADIAQILPPEVFDMASVIDVVYLVTAPIFVILFGIIAWFSRRSVRQNDEAWKAAERKFDLLIDKIGDLTKVASVTEARLNMHIDDKSAHNYGRCDKDV